MGDVGDGYPLFVVVHNICEQVSKTRGSSQRISAQLSPALWYQMIG